MSDQTHFPDPLEDLQSNVWKFYVYKTLWGLGGGLMLPIIVLYFLARDFTLAEFMTLLSVLNLSVFVFEVPTGVVADKFSRKWSICFGTFFMGLSVLITLTTVYYPLLIIGFMAWGLGESLVSGADSALLYDSLQAEGMAARFQQNIGTAISLQLAATVSGTILCGIIVGRAGLRGPLLSALGVILLAMLVTTLFKEPPFLQAARKETDRSFNAQVSSYITHLKASFRFIRQSRELMVLIVINIVILRMAFLTERPFAQPYLASFGYNPRHISYLHTLFYGISALFAKYSHTLTTRVGDNERNSLSLVGLLGIIFLAIMVNAWSSMVVVIGITGIYLMKGIFDPLMQDSLNRRMTSEKRASCLSIAKMGQNFLGIFLGPLFGYLSDVFSLQLSLLIFQWTFALFISVSIMWGWKILGQRTEPEPAIPDSG